MSNRKTDTVSMRIDIPRELYNKVVAAASELSMPMTSIIQMLVRYHLSSLDLEHNTRAALKAIAIKNKQELKLSARQKRIIENVAVDDGFTNDLL